MQQLRPEPRQSPPYVAKIGREWRIVVPVRGKLCPKIAVPTFLTREVADLWLRSCDGQQAVMRCRERPARAQTSDPMPPDLRLVQPPVPFSS
jgi:hypothetical protein